MTDDITHETVTVPEEIELPRALDFYDMQDAEHTRIHEFYENLRDGEFSTTRCRECDGVQFPPRIICPECHSENLTYTSLPTEGEVYTFTEVRGTAAIGLNDDTPFVVGVVDLGPVKLSARIDDASVDDLAIGDTVRLKIVDIDGPRDHDRVFYRFEPV